MNLRRLAALVALSLAQGVGSAARAEAPPSPAAEGELNVWPFMVKHRPNGAENTRGWNVAGPLLFSQPAADPAGNTGQGAANLTWTLAQRDTVPPTVVEVVVQDGQLQPLRVDKIEIRLSEPMSVAAIWSRSLWICSVRSRLTL